MMNVAVVLPSDFEEGSIGGMSTAVKTFLRSTQDYPFNITLFGLCWKREERVGRLYQRTVHGVSYPFIPLCRLTRWEVGGLRPFIPLRAKMFWACLLKRRHVTQRLFDVLYLHGPELFPLMLAQRARIIYHAHGTEEWVARYSRYRLCRTPAFQNLYGRMIDLIGSRADRFVCIDQQSYNTYRMRRWARPHDVRLVWGSVDDSLFRPLPQAIRNEIRERYGVPQDAKVILSIGRLTRLKGVHLVIEAMARLARKRSDIHLLVAGDGGEASALREQVDANRLQSRIHFLGAVPHEETPNLYAGSDVTVVASEQESLGFTILESLACGTPVVSTCVGVAPHVIQERQTGFLLAHRNAETLTAGIEAGLCLPVDQRAVCVETARSFGQSAKEVCDLIAELGHDRNHCA